MEKKVVYKKPKWFRRVMSSIVDLFASIVLGLLLSFIVNPILNVSFNYDEIVTQEYQYMVDTHLYNFNDNGTVSLISDNKTYDENLTYFYDKCLNDLEKYQNLKKERTDLFTFDETKNVYVEIPYEYDDYERKGEYSSFYNKLLEDLTTKNDSDFQNYLRQNENYVAISNKVSLMSLLELYICAFTSLLVIYLIIPLISKQGKTIGKMLFKLKIISLASIEPKPKKIQIAFRGLVTIIMEYLVSISTIALFGIPFPIILIISVVLMLLTKYHQTFHDLCCSTMIVDDDSLQVPINEGDKYYITYKNVD